MTPVVRRAIFGPVMVTGLLMGLALAAAAGPVLHAGWTLAWLLLGLTAGYALSGSA
ncbi:MAG TPA: hypothetical protein VGL88_01700 [Pseudonocardiaceae bacterium]|jgi:hypothetical protein